MSNADMVSIKELIKNGRLVIDMDAEAGYYGETEVFARLKLDGEVLHTETTCTSCNCPNYDYNP